MKVLFVCNFAAPYRVKFWNELCKYCDVTVLFSETIQQQEKSQHRNRKWFVESKYLFHNEILKQTRLTHNLHICLGVKKYLKQNYDIIVFHPYSPLSCIYGICYCIRNKIPYVINSDGGFAKNGKGFYEKLKKYLISHSEGCLSTGKKTDEYLKFYGAKANRLYRYQLTSVQESDILKQPCSLENNKKLKKELNILEDNVIVSVGNHIPRKGFESLLQAARKVKKNIGIYIIGGQAPQELLKFCRENSLDKVYFLDFMKKEKLQEYYMAADLFVLPTREDIWGLVINEALSNGLPVITTNRCIAGLELIEHEKNGFIYKVDDMDTLAKLIDEFFEDIEKRSMIEKNVIEKIQGNSIEAMAKRHYEIFNVIRNNRTKWG